jgi:hypothetical protein
VRTGFAQFSDVFIITHLKLTAIFLLVCMQTVFEADRAKEGFYIRSGIVVIGKNSLIKDNTEI